MSSSQSCSNALGAFVDHAASSQIEESLYSQQGVSYFKGTTIKCTPFSTIKQKASLNTGVADFGNEVSWSMSRVGDYAFRAFVSYTLPDLRMAPVTHSLTNDEGILSSSVRWCRNPGHNLFKEISLTANDLCLQRFTSNYLDMNSEFSVTASKKVGYRNMIGDIPRLTNPTQLGTSEVTVGGHLCTTDLPFGFCRDSGNAIPLAATPYNDLKVSTQLLPIDELLVIDEKWQHKKADGITYERIVSRKVVASDFVGGVMPRLTDFAPHFMYGIVANQERKAMACNSRDMVWEQTQQVPKCPFSKNTAGCLNVDLRLTGTVTCIMFGLENVTYTNARSNYTANQPVRTPTSLHYEHSSNHDPVYEFGLTYENTPRDQGHASYYSTMSPYMFAPVIPEFTGHHLYSYALNIESGQPCGSANYSKLSNVAVSLKLTDLAQSFQNFAASDVQDFIANHHVHENQNYAVVIVVKNYNIIRSSGGALGFPVM